MIFIYALLSVKYLESLYRAERLELFHCSFVSILRSVFSNDSSLISGKRKPYASLAVLLVLRIEQLHLTIVSQLSPSAISWIIGKDTVGWK